MTKGKFENQKEIDPRCIDLADKLECLAAELDWGEGGPPKVIPQVIGLLRSGNIQSAKDTFHWESDKLLALRGYRPFRRVLFDEDD